MIRTFTVSRGVFGQQLKSAVRATGLVGLALSAVPQAVILGWLLRQREVFQSYERLVTDTDAGLTTTIFASPAQVAQITVGTFILTLWTVQVVRFGFSLTQEIALGTYDLTLAAGTRMRVVLFVKSLAFMLIGLAAGLIAFGTTALTAWQLPNVEYPFEMVAAIAVTVVGVLATSSVFVPFVVLARGRSGFFSAFVPLGVVLGGFLFPVEFLPAVLEWAARVIPMSWGMDAVVGAATADLTPQEIGRACGISLAISAVWAAVTVHLLQRIERRVRMTGTIQG